MNRPWSALGCAVILLSLVGASCLAISPAPIASSMGTLGDRHLATDAVQPSNVMRLSALDGSASVRIVLTLAPPNESVLAERVAGFSDPFSPSYRHFLTESEYESQYTPHPSEVSKVTAYLAVQGPGRIEVTPDHSAIEWTTTARTADRALGVSLATYGWMGHVPLYTTLTSPQLPSEIAPLVSGIDGMSDAGLVAMERPRLSLSPVFDKTPHGPDQFVQDATSGSNWYIGSDFTQAYGETALFPPQTTIKNATFANGTAVATILYSDFNVTSLRELPPFDPQVVKDYFNDTFAANWPKPSIQGVPVTIAGTTPPPPGFFGGFNIPPTDVEAENSLDLEMAGSAAPGTALYDFYFSQTLLQTNGSGPMGDPTDLFAICLSSALSYDYGTSRLTSVSNSYGFSDENNSLWNAELLHAAAIGVTVVAASGDQGNAPTSLTSRPQGSAPTWPATAAFNDSGVISVGGVSPTMSGTPTAIYQNGSLNVTYDAGAGVLANQTAWWDDTSPSGSWAGTEGGASSIFSEPPWQFDSAAQSSVVNATVQQGLPTLGRSGPDVAFPANDTIVYIARDSNNTYFTVVAGTSLASPFFAGMIAELTAVGGHLLGFVDPELYRMGSYYSMFPGASDPFLDVRWGANYLFSAGPGWDATTGWGGVYAPLFIEADANATVRDYRYVGPTPGLPPPSSSSSAPLSSNTTVILVILGLAGAAFVVFVLAFGRRSRGTPPPPPSWTPPTFVSGGGARSVPTAPPPPPSWESPRPPGYGAPLPSTATFECPYCGMMRPAEPVRCPNCGAL